MLLLSNNSIEARDYIMKNPPDLAILDIMMPELYGLELLKKFGKLTTTQ